MAISLLPTSPNRGMSPDVFTPTMDAWIAALPQFVTDANALAANLNSIAAGGAYSLAYKWGVSVNVSVGFSAGGNAAFADGGSNNNVVAPASAVALYLDTKDASGASTYALLPSLTSGNTSATKGYLRLVKLGDPSKWARFTITGFNQNSALYNSFTISFIDSSSTTPFVAGDTVLLFFQRTGDKGDAGSLTQVIHIRESEATGVQGGSAPANGTTVRVLNSTVKNTITGASLSANQVTLPAGTYRFTASAPAYNVGSHRVDLYNASGPTLLQNGTIEYSSGSQTRSIIQRVELVFAISTTVYLQHYTNTAVGTNGLGVAAVSGLGIFTDMFIEKVS